MKIRQQLDKLTPKDFEIYSVWKFVSDDAVDETMVQGLKVPVQHLFNRIVGTLVLLANGKQVWAILGNIDVNNQESTEHFLTISIFKKDKLFHLARYHDADCDKCDSKSLAKFLGLTVENVFPITYDLTHFCSQKSSVLIGKIEKKPKRKLSQKKLFALASMI
jgi:hypothetical protein